MNKNRTTVAAGILALALVVGGFALYNNRTAQKAPEQTAQTEIDEPSTAASATPDETDTTDTTTGDTTDTKAPATTTNSNNTTTDTGSTTSNTEIPETYTVIKGDTLRDIAKRYYGDPVYSGDIERVNNLPDANSITVGKVLKLPRRDELNNTPTTDNQMDKNEKADTTPAH